MNWKFIIIGTLVFWVVTNALSFVTGAFIHEGVLEPVYRANESFWIEPLRQDPPDMAAVMPYWLMTSLISSLVVAGIYDCVHNSFKGPGWKKGMTWGLCLGIFSCGTYMGFAGMFDLPAKLFIWWGVDALILFLIGGAAMGWAAHRFAGE